MKSVENTRTRRVSNTLNSTCQHPEITARYPIYCERCKVQQALAVRVLDRLVAAADEDAFESDNFPTSGDDDDHDTHSTNAEQRRGQIDKFGGGSNFSLAGRVKRNRRRSSSANSLSVSEVDGFTPL